MKKRSGKSKQNVVAIRELKATVIRHVGNLGVLAQEAGISRPLLSLYINGRRASYKRQVQIYQAYCRLTHMRPTHRGVAKFWGELLSERIPA